MKSKKWLLAITVLTLAISTALAGCSGGKANDAGSSSSSAETPGSSSPSASSGEPAPSGYGDVMDIDWYVNLSWWKYPGEYGKDKFSQYIRDQFGLNINFITPAGDGADQMSAMIATGEIPDLVTVESWLDYKTKLAKGGYIAPLNDLIEKHTPEFKPYQDIFNWYKESDGKTYVLPNFAYSTQAMKPGEQLEPNSGFTLRQDIYEQLGKPDISTAGKFLDVLERVKKEAGKYNGKPVIPLQLYEFTSNGNGSVDWLREYFAVPYEDAGGKLLNRTYQDKYWEVLKFLNEAYRRGLISKDNFTDKRDQINEKIASGRVFAQLTAPQDFIAPMKTLYNADNKAVYEAFALRNYEGEDPVLSDIRGFGWLVTMVGKNAKAQDRIMKLLSFLNSKEGQMMVWFGWEDETYTKNADGTIQWTQAYKDAQAKGDGSDKQWGIGFNLLMDYYSVKDLFPQPDTQVDAIVNDHNMKKPLVAYSYDMTAVNGKPIPDHPDRDKMLETGNRLSLFWGKELPRIIMAESEQKARALFDETLKKMDEMGRPALDAYNDELFQNAKQTLGIEHSWPPLRK